MSETTLITSTRELSRDLSVSDETHQISCRIVEFEDKTIIDLLQDGKMDASYDIQLPKIGVKPIRDVNDLESSIVPKLLIGPADNMKNQVTASQIGTLISQFQHKNIILNMSGMIFKGEDFTPNDFTKLQFLVKIVKDTYTSRK